MAKTDNITPVPGEGPRDTAGTIKPNQIITSPGEGGRVAAGDGSVLLTAFYDNFGGQFLVTLSDISYWDGNAAATPMITLAATGGAANLQAAINGAVRTIALNDAPTKQCAIFGLAALNALTADMAPVAGLTATGIISN